MNDPTAPCAWTRAHLDQRQDGTLSRRAARRLDTHLAACPACREEADALARLRAAAAALPRSIEPGRELWPGIAARLAAPRRRWPAAAWRAPAAGLVWRRALAALLLVAAGFAAGRLAAPAAPGGAPAATPAESPGFAAAELTYLKAKEGLWRDAYRRRDALPRATVDVVERNLEIIDRAIGELEEALARDPGDRRLEELLLARHKNEIALLRRLAAPPAEA